MKTLFLIILFFGLGLAGGMVLFDGNMPGNGASGSEEKKPLYWVAPMDKNYRRDQPGKSPMGMDLVPVYEEDGGADDNSVRISPVVENNLGVKLATVSRDKLVMPIRTIGTVQLDESRITHVHSRVEGWIERLGVAATGDPVRKGQTLFELYSPALVSAQEEYLAAIRSGNRNLVRASETRLLALGISREQIRALAQRRKVEQTISVQAEKDGFVLALNVREGMFIKPATEVMAFGTLDSVWLIGEVFERQAYLVKQGQTVEVSLNSMPDRAWSGSINYIYPQLDPFARTLNVRVRLANPEQLLKPNMLVQMNILSEASEADLNIPRAALIKAENHSRVVKALGDGRYQSVVVKAGLEAEVQGEYGREQRVQILEGLEEGERVVRSAQFLIDSESNVEAELLRMEAPIEAPMEALADQGTKPGNKVVTQGKVHKVMEQMGMVSITHAPIPEWDWPTMKMDFPVDPSVPLDRFVAGQELVFELEKTGDWDYLITATGDDVMNTAQEESRALSGAPQGAVKTSGEVTMLMLDMNMLEVVHEPIPEWDWPVMRMTFVVKEDETLPSLAEGDKVDFLLRELDSGDYEMSAIRKRNSKQSK